MVNYSAVNSSSFEPEVQPDSDALFWFISVTYCCVELIGIVGNSLVIQTVLCNRKMRSCCTNIFILNIAVADLIVMLIGIAEITREFLNQGWIFGLVACKVQRYVLTTAMYASVLTMMVLSVERYIVTVHAIQSRTRLMCTIRVASVAISLIWPTAFLCASPTLVWNKLEPEYGMLACKQMVPLDLYYRTAECVIFYITPLTIQAVLYGIVSKHLFRSTKRLQTGDLMQDDSMRGSSKMTFKQMPRRSVSANIAIASRRSSLNNESTFGTLTPCLKCNSKYSLASGPNYRKDSCSRLIPSMPQQSSMTPLQPNIVLVKDAKQHAIEARKQVVRMLMACVALYALAYSPTLFNTVLGLLIPPEVKQFIRIFSMCLVYINHASNPIIYAIFSTQFRNAFRMTFVALYVAPRNCLQRRQEEKPAFSTSTL